MFRGLEHFQALFLCLHNCCVRGSETGCEGAREMRIFRKRNENVPEHFLCFGTFFE